MGRWQPTGIESGPCYAGLGSRVVAEGRSRARPFWDPAQPAVNDNYLGQL